MVPPFFRTCPFCRKVNVSISSYGNGSVSCDCGIAVAVKTTSWDALHEAAEKWNEEVDQMIADKGRAEDE
jgi:transcription elongation factor Elf1